VAGIGKGHCNRACLWHVTNEEGVLFGGGEGTGMKKKEPSKGGGDMGERSIKKKFR